MVVDANVLLYAVHRGARHHVAARKWLEGALSGTQTVMIPWLSLLAFVRVSTSRSVFSSPLDSAGALSYVEEWLAAPPVVPAEPGPDHAARLSALLQPFGTAGNLTNDAHLAAIALAHGVPVVSFDNDFDRFSGIERIEPGAD